MNKISVVILNWNRKEDTKECIESLLSSNINKNDTEIICVDNGSTDGSEKELKNINTNGISYEVIPTGKNLGFASGNNVGIKHALNHGSKYILILNNDTLVHKDLIYNLVNASLEHPRAGILTPKIYFAKGFEFHKDRYKKNELGKILWYAGGEIDWNNVYGKNIGVDEPDHGQFESQRSVDFATGAAIFIKSDAIVRVGMFDERYYMYLEDADLSLRMKKRGFGVVYIPKAFLWHKVAQSSRIGSELNDYYICRNRMLFGLKYANFRTKAALIKESLKLLTGGRKWQKAGIRDFYFCNFGKGSWK